jgi:hypothetical protein
VNWPSREYDHRPMRPGEDPAAEDLGRAELVNSSGMQNTVAVLGFSALIIVPLAWVLARLNEWRLVRRAKRT